MLSFSCGFGVFPIDVYAIEPEVLDEFDGRGREFLSTGGGGCWDREIRGIGPAAD